MRISIIQTAPAMGAFEENVEAIAARLTETQGIVFAPEGSVEGLRGRAALAWPALRARRDAALERLAKAALEAQRILLMPVAHPDGARPAVFGAGPGMRLLEPGEVLEIDGATVALAPADEADVFWRWRGFHKPWKALPERFGRASVFVSTSVAGTDAPETARGASFVETAEGRALAADFAADLLTVSTDELPRRAEDTPLELVRYRALVAGVRDYVARTGANGVAIGLSGGIDSALTAAVAVDALGADRVWGVMLRSRFTSGESIELVRRLCAGLGLPYVERSIESLHEACRSDFEEDLGELETGDVTDQNVQARLRMLRLMAVANRRGLILLCNANKAECAMGYGTLYGDIAGGFAPLADLWKDEERALCRAKNREAGREVIPEAIIGREPTAELRPGQKDSDSLPPYERIEAAMERALKLSDGEDPGTWTDEERAIIRKAMGFAFKRAQAPLGLRMSERTLADWDAALGMNRAGGI